MDSAREDLEIIMRQTSYTEEQAKSKYQEFAGNVEKVISDFLSDGDIKQKNVTNNKITSLNQEIYKQIRDFMS